MVNTIGEEGNGKPPHKIHSRIHAQSPVYDFCYARNRVCDAGTVQCIFALYCNMLLSCVAIYSSQLGKKRKVSINSFKGRRLIDIREYYEADNGVEKPGKKGKLHAESFSFFLRIR